MSRVNTGIATTVFLMMALAHPAFADPIQYPDGSWRWAATSRWLPEITVGVGDFCDFELEAGERVRQALISDSLRWKLSDGESGISTPHVFVKPTEENIRAFLTITTTRRVYHVRVVSTSGTGHEYVGFYYPQPLQLRQAKPIPTPPPTTTCGGSLDTGYRFKGAKEFLPRSVCNDGAHTYVNMGPIEGSLPVLVVVGDNGHDQIGNFSYDNARSQYIIDGAPQRLALLRNGGKGQFRVNIQRGRAKK